MFRSVLALLILILFIAAPVTGREDVYLAPEDFLAETFGEDTPPAKTLWIKGDLRQSLTPFYPHTRPPLRARYWGRGQRTAWILEEIGKEEFITTGIVVDNDRIERIKVLIYRESRGWEVRHDFFSDQFIGAGLTGDRRLSRSIDNISGATLSVNALTGLARAALTLHGQTEFTGASR